MNRQRDADAGVDALCGEIVQRYHAALQQTLPRISQCLTQLDSGSASAQLASIRLAFSDLADQIRSNLAKEENLLFPAIEALSAAERAQARPSPLPFVTLLHPIRVMEAEHVRIEQAVDRLREAARSLDEPCSRSEQWQRCLVDLAALDAELREHHRTENEELFPRALDLERRVL